MIQHHPDDNMLTEYASGSLAWALGIGISAHLQLCPKCRERVAGLNKLGGAILSHSVAEPVQENAFSNLMARIHQLPAQAAVAPKVQQLHAVYQRNPLMQQLPKVIARLLPKDGSLKWQRASISLKIARLSTGQQEYEVAFQHMRSGGTVFEHDHKGVEVTLVLHGSFSDEDGIYNEGDFLVRNPGDVHKPTATLNQDCLCLSIAEAPVHVTGLVGKLVNPFLGFSPR
jgi:putative transcriptional regulator